MSRSKTADMQSIRRKSLRTSYVRQKIEFPSLSPKSLHTRSGQSAPSSGSIASTPKLRIDFCGRVAISAVRHNGRREQVAARGDGAGSYADWLNVGRNRAALLY